MTIAKEEVLGPVLSILTYEDEDDAIRIANESVYGLGGAANRKIPREHSALHRKFGLAR